MVASFYVRPSAGEQVQTAVSLSADSRPALFGTVEDENGKPLTDALVVLSESGQTEPDRIVAVEYTDAMGQFAFGPLTAGTLYQVHISRTAVRLRTLEH